MFDFFKWIGLAKSPYRRILAVGDIHGMSERYYSLMRQVQFDADKDFLIFLGDYIDRGPDSISILENVKNLAVSPNVVCLKGNHEQMFLDYFDETSNDKSWKEDGSFYTIHEFSSLKKNNPEKFSELYHFVTSMPLVHEMTIKGKSYAFVHAGISPYKTLSEQTEYDVLWTREPFYSKYRGALYFVVGHTPTIFFTDISFKPLILPNHIILMDTGSYLPEGKLSCMDLLSGKIYQSD